MFLYGINIDIRPFTRAEFHQFYQGYVSDPVMDPNPYVYDSAYVDAFFDRCEAKAAYYPTFGIFLKNGLPIGLMNLKRIDREKSRCELAIVLMDDAYKGHGIGGEACRMLVEYAFSELGLMYVYADTMGSNVRMQHILGRLGFSLLSREERFYDMRDRWEHKLNYVLNLNDFRKEGNMDTETFNMIKSKAGTFGFSSFEYLEYEHVATYRVIIDSPELILVFGHNDSAGCEEVYWAANDPQALIAAIRERGCPVLVTFVPEDWKAMFIEQGFTE